MEFNMKVWCLFEQSGTFKTQFLKLGYEALDLDILNEFNQTDLQIDLFKEIHKEYKYYQTIAEQPTTPKALYPTIFDNIKPTDLVIAFYPCTRFVEKNLMNSRCENAGMKNWTPQQKLKYSMKLFNEINEHYQTISKLVYIAIEKGFPLIIENPASNQHILTSYFPYKPQVTIKDRSAFGDYYKKPTNFWFINRDPSNNTVLANPRPNHKTMRNDLASLERNGMTKRLTQTEKSLMSPEFARYFIEAYII